MREVCDSEVCGLYGEYVGYTLCVLREAYEIEVWMVSEGTYKFCFKWVIDGFMINIVFFFLDRND